jgi:hypothetical protein
MVASRTALSRIEPISFLHAPSQVSPPISLMTFRAWLDVNNNDATSPLRGRKMSSASLVFATSDCRYDSLQPPTLNGVKQR